MNKKKLIPKGQFGMQTFIQNWYTNRAAQIQNNLKEVGMSQSQWNKQMQNLKTVKIYKHNSLLPQSIKKKNTKYDFDPRYTEGMYLPDYHTLFFNSKNPGKSIQVHEGTHSQQPEVQGEIIPRHIKLKNGVQYNSYYDDPDEINSRIMEFRYNNKLDPNKKYTIEEIKKMKDSGDAKDLWGPEGRPTDILNRYDDKTLLWLINELAQNNQNDNLQNDIFSYQYT